MGSSRSGHADRPVYPVAHPRLLEAALGAPPRFTGRSRDDLVVLLDNEETVVNISPDLQLLRLLPTYTVVVTAASAMPGYDFVTRQFPTSGDRLDSRETWSAYCCLGPFWRSRTGKNRLHGYQASSSGGYLDIMYEDGKVTVYRNRNRSPGSATIN